MCRRESLRRWEDVFGDRVEYTRVFSEDADVEHFLWVTETEMFELGV